MKFREITKVSKFSLVQEQNHKVLDGWIIIEDGNESVVGEGATCKVKKVKGEVINEKNEEID
jgi:hypothetical protein